MKTVKEVLTNNRESIISTIKWTFKVWKAEDVKTKMVEFLAWAENHESDILKAEDSKKTKTILRGYVMNMAYEQNKPMIEARKKEQEEKNIRLYGTPTPKLADIMSKRADQEEEKGNVWHPIYKTWVKNEDFNSSMQKKPKFV